jgi:hypothetical protein
LNDTLKGEDFLSIKFAKRGRPSNAEIAARQQKVAPVVRSDSQILNDLRERFDILGVLTKGALTSNIRALVVTGAPGVGKTYTVEQILSASENETEVIRGTLSAINLYMMAYKYRRPGNVIVLDDADDIFNDIDALNILKALCDTSDVRKVSYLKEAIQLKENDIPQQFEFNGSLIFVSNIDFSKFVEGGNTKYGPHMGALMSRSMYLDLQIHDRNTLGVWVNHLATSAKIFDIDEVPHHIRPKILKFLTDHRDNLHELSIRTLKKLNSLAKSEPMRWESIAKVVLCKVQ